MSTPDVHFSQRDSFKPLIIGIGGTSRSNSTTERSVTVALESAEALGARIKLFDGNFVSRLPMYDPQRSIRSDDEREFIEAIRACHGVIVGTPGYHGSLSGPTKNILDLLEDTARDSRPYLDGCAFGCVVTAYGWQACGTTLVSLRLVAHALRAWPTPFGAALNASTPLFDNDGACLDSKTFEHLSIVARQVVDFARWRHSNINCASPIETACTAFDN